MHTCYLSILDSLADWEPGYVLAELRSGRYLKDPSYRYNVLTCGHSMDPITTMGGLHISPEMLISDIQPSDGDVLLLPGADIWLDPSQQQTLATAGRLLGEGMIVAAICGATLGLASAGLLDHRPHTSNDLAALRMFCPAYKGEEHYVNTPAVTDGTLITASGLAPAEFAHQIFKRLDVMKPKTLEAWFRLNNIRKPECFHALMQSLTHPPRVQ